MAFEIKVTKYPPSAHDPMHQTIAATYSDVLDIVPEYLIQTIVSRIADQFIEDHYAEIVKEISPTVVAAVASKAAGATIMKRLEEEVDHINVVAEEALRKAKRR
jgi:hypothetical protein